MNSRRRKPTVWGKRTNPAGVELNIVQPLRGRCRLERYRGLSPPAIHIQSLRDWLEARRLPYNSLDPRFRGDDILISLLGKDQPPFGYRSARRERKLFLL